MADGKLKQLIREQRQCKLTCYSVYYSVKYVTQGFKNGK